MNDLLLILTSGTLSTLVLIVGSIEIFAYNLMSKHIISLHFPLGHIYNVGDGILHEGKKYVIIYIDNDRVLALKTLSNIVNDWRNK